MTVSPKQITIGASAFLALMLAVIVWRWLFPPFPDEQQVIALYDAHKQEFAALSKMTEKYCGKEWRPTEVAAAASRIDRHMVVTCDYSGTQRFILGERGLMTIGPEQIIGLTRIPGDPAGSGTVVSVLGPHEQEIGYVYLRRVESHWYVFTQNTD
jgi:hypothetical protein